jgi:choline-phosphate cytidylyltransferase
MAKAQAIEKPDGSDPLNPVRVYADGVFDMYHIGHAKLLRQCKQLFKHVHLIVGVSGDKETIEKKGKIVFTEDERSQILLHCKWVDDLIMPCPWVITIPFLLKHNIHYVAHDDLPYGSVGQEDIYAEIKRAGMFKATQRTEGISTSDIILRIIKDYDMYVQRSLERGYGRKEIGVSNTKLARIKIGSQFRKWSDSIKNKAKKNGEKIDREYD